MGQLFARSTQGVRQSLCRLCPQGWRWAIRAGASSAALLVDIVAWASTDAGLSSPFSVGDLAKAEESAGTSLELSPRSPRQTMQVPDIGRSKKEIYGSKKELWWHEGKFMWDCRVEDVEEQTKASAQVATLKGQDKRTLGQRQ